MFSFESSCTKEARTTFLYLFCSVLSHRVQKKPGRHSCTCSVRCQLCCITFNDDDSTEPPYGETQSGEYHQFSKVDDGLNSINNNNYVLQTIYKSDWPHDKNYNFFLNARPQSSEDSTNYPDSTTTSESETTDSEAVELCCQLEEIYADLAILSQKLDEILYLQQLL
ncbi:hypothetical protein HNY73_020773 [Argiope bruennichi]|uniref:Uncharacterized protein n=1 Tax=Argiope bruennichi TaxID=94029 RepID=A0A8T0E983_ARGBR|nr:hypothetical protein HNY73_020773 [Argiope bruennichi]